MNIYKCKQNYFELLETNCFQSLNVRIKIKSNFNFFGRNNDEDFVITSTSTVNRSVYFSCINCMLQAIN